MSAAVEVEDRLALADRLNQFADELRARGLPISFSERIDALRAAEVTELHTTYGLHTALQATLVKTAEHLAVFDELFELYFRLDATALPAEPGQPRDEAAEVDPGVLLDLEHALRVMLQDGSSALARLIAEQSVARYARFERGHAVAGVTYEGRVIVGLRLAQISAEITAEIGAGDAGTGGAAGGDGTEGSGSGPGGGASSAGRQLSQDLRRELVLERMAEVRAQTRAVIRELLVADRGREAVAKTTRKPLPADVVIASATPQQLAEIERVMKPLQRKLATTMMRRRRHRRGAPDVGATLRASMATGGVPVRVVHRRPKPTKPQLYVLADMSDSVSTFAAFTITLVSAMSDLFSRLRAFAFVQDAVEVTELFRAAGDSLQALHAINTLDGGRLLNGRTDYGRALKRFSAEVAPHLGRRSTVLVFGDARGNYRPAEEATLADIARRAGRVYWLNPEPASQWGSGDSLMNVYAPYCTAAVTCRTLNDLRHFVEELD